jgi:hypothetical protein
MRNFYATNFLAAVPLSFPKSLFDRRYYNDEKTEITWITTYSAKDEAKITRTQRHDTYPETYS